jgi:hypothetical protein
MEKYEQPGARLVSKVPTKEFKENYEAVFGKKESWLDRKEKEAEMQEKKNHDACCGGCSGHCKDD